METHELKRRLRRDRDTLAIVGLGVMAFGVWSVIRAVVTFVLQIPELREQYAETGNANAVIILSGVAILLLLAVDLRLRFYIWRSARAEGLRGERKTGYLFAAGVLAFVSAATLGFILLAALGTNEAVVEAAKTSDGVGVSSFIVELTSLVTLVDMIAASVRVKRMTRELEEREG
ncbi:MAG: hypothetical protein E7422_06950 [Ruminococcaceae bacterium]|nr:hypothetical protein [Oscillospiraceae bacterium]